MEVPADDTTASVDATVRITPLSLLFSSAIGTVALGLIGAAGALVVPLPSLPGGTTDDLATAGLVGGLVLAGIFAVGYRRHGRPVPTTARAREGMLAVAVPAAWGKLMRDEFHLEAPRVEAGSSEKGLVVHGTAQEWWDPGTYEVRMAPEDAEGLRPRLVGEEAGPPGR